MYTCMFEASQNGGSCFDPLFFHYPTIDDAYKKMTSFVFANALYVSPALKPGAQSVSSFFPAGQWVSMNNFADVLNVKNDSWIDLPAQNGNSSVNGTVNVHLMPGKITAWQNNTDHKVMLASVMPTNDTLSLVINRDSSKGNSATGSLFLDLGLERSELENKEYQHYNVRLEAKTVKFETLNSAALDKYVGLKNVIIPNAADLKDTNFACAVDRNHGSIFDLDISFDGNTMTLEKSSSSMELFELRDIHFGDRTKDLNLCDPATQYYKFKDGKIPDLNVATVTKTLESLTPSAIRDLKLTLTILDSGILNIYWTFENMTGI